MKWPRGKYNGYRIIGVRADVELAITEWWWNIERCHGTIWIHIGPFHGWYQLKFEDGFRATEDSTRQEAT